MKKSLKKIQTYYFIQIIGPWKKAICSYIVNVLGQPKHLSFTLIIFCPEGMHVKIRVNTKASPRGVTIEVPDNKSRNSETLTIINWIIKRFDEKSPA